MITVQGLVIRSTNYGESNKILTLLTMESGKIGVMARGAKKPKSKLAPGSQLLTHGHFLVQKGRGLGQLYNADPIESFRYIKSDITVMAYAVYMIDMVDKLTEEGQAFPSLFNWLLKLLELLEEKRSPQVLRVIFDLRMLALAGIQPELDGCASCGTQTGPFAFSTAFGGLLCSSCVNKDPHAISLPNPVTRLFYILKKIDPNNIGEISVKQETVKLMSAILDDYFDHHSGIKLKSKRFLDQIEKLNPSGND